jgi:hypothetical protein
VTSDIDEVPKVTLDTLAGAVALFVHRGGRTTVTEVRLASGWEPSILGNALARAIAAGVVTRRQSVLRSTPLMHALVEAHPSTDPPAAPAEKEIRP